MRPFAFERSNKPGGKSPRQTTPIEAQKENLKDPRNPQKGKKEERSLGACPCSIQNHWRGALRSIPWD